MGHRKEFVGRVISNRMQKTIVVQVVRFKKHPKYNRVVRFVTKFKVHDENKLAQPGDIVKIQETRPLSKDKFFRLKEVLKKSQQAAVELAEDLALSEAIGEKNKSKGEAAEKTVEKIEEPKSKKAKE